MKKIKITLFILLGLVSRSMSQDPNFSQFFASPLTLNPASTGKFDGIFRVAGNYRNQWPTINNAYTTKTVSADFHILNNQLADIDRWGIGLLALNDQNGNGAIKTNQFSLSTAFHKGLDENAYHQIGVGFQGSYTNKRLDISNLDFEDELTASGFTGVTNEIFPQNGLNVKYFELNAGILYNGSTNGYNNFYAGASIYHINRPEENFQGGQFYLNTRTTLQAGGRLPFGQFDALHFSANYSFQANANNMMIGGAFAKNLNYDEANPVNVYLGTWARFNNVADAIIPYMGIEFGDILLGASYDLNISGLQPASNLRGGIEISLIYIKKPVDRDMKKLNCPKF
ncbi:MAG TPA: PorP/SprF family type IX secretion system membrane protein [Chitinophagaceae bacterium]|nr:PorP/SprF family type IX secretion system membrane protein [Chitinophagaceae bacterium]